MSFLVHDLLSFEPRYLSEMVSFSNGLHVKKKKKNSRLYTGLHNVCFNSSEGVVD